MVDAVLMIEMLLQSQPASGALDAQPMIRLLPALPEQWPQGKVTGLLARGGFEVDLEWKDNKLVECSIKSKRGDLCNVRYNGKTINLQLAANEARNLTMADFE